MNQTAENDFLTNIKCKKCNKKITWNEILHYDQLCEKCAYKEFQRENGL